MTNDYGKNLQDTIDRLLKQGIIEIVGHRNGKPVYGLTDAGRHAEALGTGTPVEGIRALPALGAKMSEMTSQRKSYTPEELKEMGAPFQQARIFMSLKERKAEVTFRVAGETLHTTIDFPTGFGSPGTVNEIVEMIAESAAAEGLITDGTVFEVYEELPPAPKPESAEIRELRVAAAKLWPSLRNRRGNDKKV
jgi:hypothetical protein